MILLNSQPLLAAPGPCRLDFDPPLHFATLIEYEASGRPPERKIAQGPNLPSIAWESRPNKRYQLTYQEHRDQVPRHAVVRETGEGVVTPPQPDPGDTFTGRDAFKKMKAAGKRAVTLSLTGKTSPVPGTITAAGIKPEDVSWQAANQAQSKPRLIIFDHGGDGGPFAASLPAMQLIAAYIPAIQLLRQHNPDAAIGAYNVPCLENFSADHPEWTRPKSEALAAGLLPHLDVCVLSGYFRTYNDRNQIPKIRAGVVEAVRICGATPVIVRLSPKVEGGEQAGSKLSIVDARDLVKACFDAGATAVDWWTQADDMSPEAGARLMGWFQPYIDAAREAAK